MKAYEQLTRHGQLRRLRELAEQGLKCYGLDHADLVLLNNVDAPVFRVDVFTASSPEPRPEHFVLRIHHPLQQSREMLCSELQWLAALRHDTELVVPDPVPNQDGELVTEVSNNHVPGSRYLVVLRWIDGEFRNAKLRKREFEAVGTFMARLHQHAQTFQPPQGFVRPQHDWAWTFGAKSVLDPGKGERVFSARQLSIFRATADSVYQHMQRLGREKEVFGLIHADLHQNNYLFRKQEVRAIDFQDCSWGYYLFDIALTLSEGQDRKNLNPKDWEEQRAAFFVGYQRVLPLPAHYEQCLKVFEIVRAVDLVNWVLSWSRLDLKRWGPRYLEHSVELLQRFLDQESKI